MTGRPQTLREMVFRAQVFFGLVVIAGAGILIYGISHWHSRNSAQELCYLLVALFACRMKVKLPGITGTMSASFLAILLAVAQLDFSVALLIGCATTLVQSISKIRPQITQLSFNICASALAIGTTDWAYHSRFLQTSSLGPALPLIAAAAVYFLANTLPIATIISLTEQKRLRRTWTECYFWAFPYYLLGAGFVGILSWLNGKINWQISLFLVPGVYLIYRSYGIYLGKLQGEKDHAEQVAQLHMRTIEVLALAIEAKDQTTHDHLQRVRIYATEIAKELKISQDELDALQAAALLHDIGKLAVPEHIVSKPGKLTPEEFEKMKIHPVVGAELLEKVEFPYPVVPIVRAHHEKWNGSGYPYGLKDTEIPIGARILAVVDFFDALTSDRQYRRAMLHEEVIAKLREEAGKSFDPSVVDVLIRRHKHLEKLVAQVVEKLSKTKLSTNVQVGNGAAPASGFENTMGREKIATSDATFLASVASAKQEVQILFELSQEMGTSLSLDDTLSVFGSKLRRLIDYDAIAIYVRRNDFLVPEHVSGENYRLFSTLRIPVGQGVSGWTASNRKPIINGNPAVEPGYAADSGHVATLNSALSVPLEGMEGVVGVVTLYHADKDAFSTDNLRILTAVSSKMALAIENALKYQQAESSAITDYLTGLPNARSMFLHLGQEMARAKRANSSLTVMVCDLDGFKQVNDRFGHLEGNRVLEIFARSVRESCREYDYVARMGGDEFVVIVSGLSTDAEAQKISQLREFARQAGRAVCHEDLLSLSIGKAVFPQDSDNMDTLLAEADRRMYAEKKYRSGKKNRRAYPRLACNVSVNIEAEDSDVPGSGMMVNISQGGCYVETGKFEIGPKQVQITIPTGQGDIQLDGDVTWSNCGVGFAVKFVAATTDNREKIQSILKFVEESVAAQARPPLYSQALAGSQK